MKSYEDKKKMSENFPPGTECLVEIENVKDPKENPFKKVIINFLINYFLNFIYREKS
jgi:hypothetical protein